MGSAVGMVEVKGWPPALSVADTMVKAASVDLVAIEKLSGAYLTVIVRGNVSDVNIAVEAGIEAAKKMRNHKEGDKLFWSSHVIARPHDNLMVILPIDYPENVAEFSA